MVDLSIAAALLWSVCVLEAICAYPPPDVQCGLTMEENRSRAPEPMTIAAGDYITVLARKDLFATLAPQTAEALWWSDGLVMQTIANPDEVRTHWMIEGHDGALTNFQVQLGPSSMSFVAEVAPYAD